MTQFRTFTDAERAALKLHGLGTHGPSQLSDAFVLGLRFAAKEREPAKLWLWKNFVDDRPEYWAFDNPYPINLTDGDPQTLGEPCGYALFKPSRQGRTDWTEEQVLLSIKKAKP